jgi:predicted pyridoxine 5'-phosphate oxidase superfamily flavin-nucleotide-binding protein
VDAPFQHLVTTLDELREELYPEPPAKAWAKEIPELDAHCRAFLERSPLAFLGTSDAAGRCDVTRGAGRPASRGFWVQTVSPSPT